MNPLISICIPTYQRPSLVQEAIESCLRQTYSEIEIIVSDDSPDQLTQQMVRSFHQPEKIRYYHNQTPLKQAKNVDRLFNLALGDRLVLLHDDDLLLPDAVAALARCWDTVPDLTAAFGKQYLIDMAGNSLMEASEQLNQRYYRTAKYAGYQASSLWSALTSQFPNDGYLITTKAAKQVGYRNHTRDERRVGDACDFDFGLRLASHNSHLFFLDEYTAKYRLTDVSVGQGRNCQHLAYDLVRSIKLPEELEPTRQAVLHRYAAPAIQRWIQLGEKRDALDIFLSDSYSWTQRLSLKGLLQLLLIACPHPWSQQLLDRLRELREQF
ncbi:glycosyl transferase family protein [Leptolyngbya sp. NIES-3755]|nr:glycosyl transferase family protein [Leptolyngbya sp. NIES-3755]